MRRRKESSEHFTKMIRDNMLSPAWTALSSSAQAAYPWFKLEWKGPKANNNGQIELSVRQLAVRMGVSRTTAAKAIHDLQAKGWLVVTRQGVLGSIGEGRSSAFEITEIALRGDNARPRYLFRKWTPNHDFSVVKPRSNNPGGVNGKTESRHRKDDVTN